MAFLNLGLKRVNLEICYQNLSSLENAPRTTDFHYKGFLRCWSMISLPPDEVFNKYTVSPSNRVRVIPAAVLRNSSFY